MRAPKKKLIVLPCLATLSVACSSGDRAISDAIHRAQASRLTSVNHAGTGVPFYSAGNLDPVWDGEGPIARIPPIALTDQDGRPVNESIFEGRTTFVAFFFTSCSGFCPVFLKHLQKVEARLRRFPDMRYVALSIDPRADRPARLKTYFKKMGFDPRSWTLLTGDEAQILRLARDTLSSEAFRLPKSGQMAHSEHFFLIDSRRRLRGALPGTRLDVAESALRLVSALDPGVLNDVAARRLRQ